MEKQRIQVPERLGMNKQSVEQLDDKYARR